MQGTFYTSGGPIGITVMSMFLLISLYYFVKVNQYGNLPIYLKGLNILVILFTVYGIIRILSPEVIYRTSSILQNPTIYLKSYYISVLPVYAFYYFVSTGKINADWLRKWAIIFIGFVIFQYCSNEISMLEMLGKEGIETEILTNNMGYYFVSLMCLIPFFNKNAIIQYIILAICAFFVISSAKRGALLCFVVSASIFFWLNLMRSSSRKKLIVFILGCGGFLGAYFYIKYMMVANASFASRFIIESSNSSGRNDFYFQVVNHILNETNIFRLLFGNGADGSIAILGNYAHNDWLEFAIDMGAIGITAYSAYYICFVRTIKETKNLTIRMSLLFLFIPCLLKSIFSMAIGDFQIYESAVLAFCLAFLNKQNIDNLICNKYV